MWVMLLFLLPLLIAAGLIAGGMHVLEIQRENQLMQEYIHSMQEFCDAMKVQYGNQKSQ